LLKGVSGNAEELKAPIGLGSALRFLIGFVPSAITFTEGMRLESKIAARIER